MSYLVVGRQVGQSLVIGGTAELTLVSRHEGMATVKLTGWPGVAELYFTGARDAELRLPGLCVLLVRTRDRDNGGGTVRIGVDVDRSVDVLRKELLPPR